MQRVNFPRIGVIALVIGIASLMTYRWYSPQVATTVMAQPESDAAATDAAFKPQASQPLVAGCEADAQQPGQVCSMPADDRYLFSSNEQILYKDGLQCAYADDAGLASCHRFIAKIIERRNGGYYESHAPAGWCNATDCPPTLTIQRQAPRQVATGNTNYVPESWGEGAQALLQYKSGVALQDWVQANLHPQR